MQIFGKMSMKVLVCYYCTQFVLDSFSNRILKKAPNQNVDQNVDLNPEKLEKVNRNFSDKNKILILVNFFLEFLRQIDNCIQLHQQ